MNIKKLYGILLKVITKIAGIDCAKKFDTRLRFHRTLNLKNPKTLADKVSYIELHEKNMLTSVCTDKWAVREYVTNKGYEDTLVPLAGGVWNSVDEVDFESLPESFVLKATHGCKMNYFVPNKNEIDMDKCRAEMVRWMKTTYGTYSMEPHYAEIPHRIYAEKYLGDMSNLTDYKFHCLNGEPQFILAFTERCADGDKAMKVKIDCFDMEWKHIKAVCGAGLEIPGEGKVAKPKHFEEMKEMARKLSADFKFVRVDLYEMNDQIYFGEMTFSPTTGVFAFLKEDFLAEMGKKLEI